MADDVKRLLLQIDASVELLKRNLQQGDAHVARFERDIQRRLATIDRSFAGVGRGVDTITGRVNALRGTAAALGIAFGAVALGGFVRSSFELAAGLSEASQRIGVTVEQLQILRRAAGEAGVSQEGLERSLGILNRRLGEARAEVPAAVQAFRALRIDPEQFNTGGEVLRTVIERLGEFRSDAELAAAGNRLFGRGFSELIPLVREGTAGLDAHTEAAIRSGLITAEQARKADEAADSLGQLATTLQTQLGAALADIMPTLTAIVQVLGFIAQAAIWAVRQIQNVLSFAGILDGGWTEIHGPGSREVQRSIPSRPIRNRADAQRLANETGRPVQIGEGEENIVRITLRCFCNVGC